MPVRNKNTFIWNWTLTITCILLLMSSVSFGQESVTTISMSKLEKETKLIPRKVLFGNPEKAAARLSPDGKWLSYLAPVDGVLNVWVGPVSDPAKAKPVTQDKVRGIRGYFWAYNGKHILYTQDIGGDENWHVYATDVAAGTTKDLTDIKGVNAQIEGVSDKFPNEILVGLNNRNPQLHDIWRVNLTTGERTLVEENPGFAGLMTDDNFRVRLAITFTPTAGQLVLLKDDSNKEGSEGMPPGWKKYMEIDSLNAMTTGPAGFDKSGDILYFKDSRKRNTSALFTINLKTGETKLVAEHDLADVGGIIAHPTEKHIQAISFTYARREWKILDPTIEKDFEFLKKLNDGEFQITSRTLDDSLWTVAYILDNGPVKYYLYDRNAKKATFLFYNRDDLTKYKLVKMHSPIIKSRDGLNLVSYLSLPPGTDTDNDGRPDKPVPMVLDVHGGPWARDGWGYNPSHQWLANRGYAVLSVNYRGSTGFGKNFINAANGEWSGKMHDDLIDAVEWAVSEGIAQRDKVAIMGGSYGGYATLVGATVTPDVFACGVDIVGPSSLLTLMKNVPPYWMPFMPVMKERVGDWTTEEGKKELMARSPIYHVDKIKKPLLIGQGANDPRVTQLEADQIVKAMNEKKIPVTYVLYPDEGHGFARPQNRFSFNAVTEAFLSKHLGGRYEPIGDAFKDSTIQIKSGADGVPGLSSALEARKTDAP